ncbi:jg19528 [Pararge aegeria aegeria]|uniref:Jg19528 protein n=1 Tax=Pararge aegeria aegeria TaxID=348720 RepID=A0A8S4R5T8_9NEOP|nr:jg19528 [Pararge aegeria aegeria]
MYSIQVRVLVRCASEIEIDQVYETDCEVRFSSSLGCCGSLVYNLYSFRMVAFLEHSRREASIAALILSSYHYLCSGTLKMRIGLNQPLHVWPLVQLLAVSLQPSVGQPPIFDILDKLFPYAEQNVKQFLETQWESSDVKEVVTALRKLALEDKEKSVDGHVTIPGEDASKEVQIEGLVNNVKWQMSSDRKAGPLKQLQGMIWKQGYDKGDIKGHVYDDVSSALEQWKSVDGQKVYIYSSGSVQAQKLLFGQSLAGDLLQYIEGHFDTAVGAKQEAASYSAIAEKIGSKPDNVLFLTDIVKEAEAARTAGLHAVLVSREGNAPLPSEATESFTVIHSLGQLTSNKRKTDPQEEQPAKVPKTDLSTDVKTTAEAEKAKKETSTEGKLNEPEKKKDEPEKKKDEPEKMEVDEESTPVQTTNEPKLNKDENKEQIAKVVVEEVKDAMDSDIPTVDEKTTIVTDNRESQADKQETEKMETDIIRKTEETKVTVDEKTVESEKVEAEKPAKSEPVIQKSESENPKSEPEKKRSEPEKQKSEPEEQKAENEKQKAENEKQKSEPEKQKLEPEKQKPVLEKPKTEPEKHTSEPENKKSEPEKKKSESDKPVEVSNKKTEVSEKLTVPKEKVEVTEVKEQAPLAEETIITEIEEITDKENLSEMVEIIEDLEPVVEEPNGSEDMELQNVGDVLEKECDEILSKVQDVTNLDNIPLKSTLNPIAEETMETDNLDSNDIMERILDQETELETQQAENAPKTVTEVVDDIKTDKVEETAEKAVKEKVVKTTEKSLEDKLDAVEEKTKSEETKDAKDQIIATKANNVSEVKGTDSKIEKEIPPEVTAKDTSQKVEEKSKPESASKTEETKVEDKVATSSEKTDENTLADSKEKDKATEEQKPKESAPEVNGDATNGDKESVNQNGDSKVEELSSRLSVENGKEVNGSNGDSMDAENGTDKKSNLLKHKISCVGRDVIPGVVTLVLITRQD